jgi:predicted dehydrogenase
VTATVQATTGALPEQPPSVEIHGDRGTARVSGSWGTLTFHLRTGGDVADDATPAPRPAGTAVEPYAAQIADFVAAVREGRSPLVDGVEARKALVVVEALYRSAAAGSWVNLQGGLGRDPPDRPPRKRGLFDGLRPLGRARIGKTQRSRFGCPSRPVTR